MHTLLHTHRFERPHLGTQPLDVRSGGSRGSVGYLVCKMDAISPGDFEQFFNVPEPRPPQNEFSLRRQIISCRPLLRQPSVASSPRIQPAQRKRDQQTQRKGGALIGPPCGVATWLLFRMNVVWPSQSKTCDIPENEMNLHKGTCTAKRLSTLAYNSNYFHRQRNLFVATNNMVLIA